MIFIYLGFVNAPVLLALGLWYRSAVVTGIAILNGIVTFLLWYTNHRTGWITKDERGS